MHRPPTIPTESRKGAAAVRAAGAGAVLALSALVPAPVLAAENAGKGMDPFREVRVSQPEGRITYWVLRGPRVLEKKVFGIPGDPQMLLEPKLQAAMGSRGPPAVPETLKKLPTMVAVPEEARSVTDYGTYVLKQPNPFSNKARIISGQFETTMKHVVRQDPPGKPGKTPDTASFEAEFTDPAGNDYRLVLDHVVKPPFPGTRPRAACSPRTSCTARPVPARR